eukprot:XP_011663887.1 PREDICTED: autophagy-related protein 9A [Strongylocentrotus purpuratus]
MCIHKAELTELDIYHRILRFKNYMVAMVNKSLLPLHHHPPFLGDTVFLTNSLKYNIEMILFWGPWAPFRNYWHLKDEYKRSSKREELARQLSKHILWIGLANLILCPFIFLWQILYSFFSYAELIKRDPSTLGARKWSQYGRLYLRHFNELDHEFQARLNRGYKPAKKYLDAFTSNVLAIICQSYNTPRNNHPTPEPTPPPKQQHQNQTPTSGTNTTHQQENDAKMNKKQHPPETATTTAEPTHQHQNQHRPTKNNNTRTNITTTSPQNSNNNSQNQHHHATIKTQATFHTTTMAAIP